VWGKSRRGFQRERKSRASIVPNSREKKKKKRKRKNGRKRPQYEAGSGKRAKRPYGQRARKVVRLGQGEKKKGRKRGDRHLDSKSEKKGSRIPFEQSVIKEKGKTGKRRVLRLLLEKKKKNPTPKERVGKKIGRDAPKLQIKRKKKKEREGGGTWPGGMRAEKTPRLHPHATRIGEKRSRILPFH